MKCLDEKIGIDKKSVFSSNIVVQKILVQCTCINVLDRCRYMYLFHSLKKNIKQLINGQLLSCFTDSNTKNWQKDRPEESDSDQFKSLHNIHVYIYRMMTANENNVNKIWMNIQKSFFILLAHSTSLFLHLNKLMYSKTNYKYLFNMSWNKFTQSNSLKMTTF